MGFVSSLGTGRNWMAVRRCYLASALLSNLSNEPS